MKKIQKNVAGQKKVTGTGRLESKNWKMKGETEEKLKEEKNLKEVKLEE